MKSNIIKYLAATAAAIGMVASVQATAITGTIRMNGDVVLDQQDLATATAATGFSGVTVSGSPTGSFTGTGGAAVTWAPFAWNPTTLPVGALWTFMSGGNTYSFDLTSISGYSQDSTVLVVTGAGTVSISGGAYDPTPANWSFTVTDTSGGTGGSFTFGFADSNTAVPDGGATAMLMGAALTGLALIRRKLA